jgi:hypothetical protein
MTSTKQILHVAVIAAMTAMASSPSYASVATGLLANYATQAVTANAGDIRYPSWATWTNDAVVPLPAGNTVTFTLPSGMTFDGNPSFESVPAAAFTIQTGGSGSSSITFQTTAAFPVGGTLTIGSVIPVGFQLSDATALESPVDPATPLRISALPSTATPSADAFLATNALVANFAPEFPTTTIAVAAPSNATQYNLPAGGTGVQASLGRVSTSTVAGLLDEAGDPYAFPAGTETAVTVTGNFSTIVNAFALPWSVDDCPATMPGTGEPGVVTAGASITIATVPAPGDYKLCIVTDGTSIIQANEEFTNATGVLTNAIGSFSGILGRQLYDGSVDTFNFAFGEEAGWSVYFSGSNRSLSDQPVTAVVYTAAGGPVFNGQLADVLPAGGQHLFSMADIATATSAPITGTADHASVILLTPGGGNVVDFQKILQTPAGGVSETNF